ncbi:hypothetical protein DRE_04626 [Drechslerella stenobrocha 248]|uniref:CDC45-like protein n=1 Tax=Drechslerella stenobrocha 248 TaxID=1043628 RepID=W7I0P6_9PEZI|nr:hypothetical protein DRE_04626 [Drechslerella stenobrocha 248]
MHIPRHQFGAAYNRLKRSSSATVPSVLILTSLDVDSLCACRMLTRLLKSDYIPHKLHPVAGYQDLAKANKEFIATNDDLKFLVLLGVGGLVDIAELLELRSGVECWVIESRRPWNLQNIFAGPGGEGYGVVSKAGQPPEEGGVICWDDGDVSDFLQPEEQAYKELIEMQAEVGDIDDWDSEGDEDEEFAENRRRNGAYVEESEDTPSSTNSRKRRSSSDDEDDDDEEEDGYSDDDRGQRKRIRSGSSTPDSSPHAYSNLIHIHGPGATATTTAGTNTSLTLPTTAPTSAPSLRWQRKTFVQLRRKHNKTLTDYYATGSTYGEPISSLIFSLASDLGREDNDLLWLAIVGWEGQQMYGRHMHSFSGDQTLTSVSARSIGVWGILRDEVRRLNPPSVTGGANTGHLSSNSSLFTRATTAEDYSLRLSPEFRFLLIRHWSLYDSMLHSPYLASKLHLWSEHGRKRLHKLLATMGTSLQQCNQKYVYMDMDLKRGLRDKLEVYKGRYGLEEIVREGVVKCWGWNGCLSAGDVAVIVGCLLEVGRSGRRRNQAFERLPSRGGQRGSRRGYIHTPVRADQACTPPSALTKLALWLAEAIREQELEKGASKSRGMPLVVAALNEARGCYIIVGTGVGNVEGWNKEGRKVADDATNTKKKKKKEKLKKKKKKKGADDDDDEEEEEEEEEEEDDDEDSDSDSDDEDDNGGRKVLGRNRFGIAFQEVANETAARVRIDSFEACVVEVRKEDLGGFLEGLSMKDIIA